GSSCCRVEVGLPGETNWPRLTRHLPDSPDQAARLVLCAASARLASNCVLAFLDDRPRYFHSSCQTSSYLPSRRPRSAWPPPSPAVLSSALSVATALSVFRPTRTAPALTGWPGSNSIARTTPPASVVTSVPLTATKVPTASPSSLQRSTVAVA